MLQSSTLKANTKRLESQIGALTTSSETLQRDLSRAQKALDRQKMEHDKAAREWQAQRDQRDSREAGASTPEVEKPANGSGRSTPNGKMEIVSLFFALILRLELTRSF